MFYGLCCPLQSYISSQCCLESDDAGKACTNKGVSGSLFDMRLIHIGSENWGQNFLFWVSPTFRQPVYRDSFIRAEPWVPSKLSAVSVKCTCNPAFCSAAMGGSPASTLLLSEEGTQQQQGAEVHRLHPFLKLHHCGNNQQMLSLPITYGLLYQARKTRHLWNGNSILRVSIFWRDDFKGREEARRAVS